MDDDPDKTFAGETNLLPRKSPILLAVFHISTLNLSAFSMMWPNILS